MACQVSAPSKLEHDKRSVSLDGHWYQIPKNMGRIRELQFSGTKLWVTYTPFEAYRDFWGSFNWDPETHGIRMTIEHANHAPEPFEGRGTLQFITPNQIRISGVTLDDHDPRLKSFTFERFDTNKEYRTSRVVTTPTSRSVSMIFHDHNINPVIDVRPRW
jgi:hypothetical protein